MLRALAAVVSLGLTIFALADCIQTEDRVVRGIPRWAWIVLIVLIPLAGPLTWLLVGKDRSGGEPRRGGPGGGGGGTPSSGSGGRPRRARSTFMLTRLMLVFSGGRSSSANQRSSSVSPLSSGQAVASAAAGTVPCVRRPTRYTSSPFG